MRKATPGSYREQALDYIRGVGGVAQLREFCELGIPTVVLRRMNEAGVVLNPIRGIYVLPGIDQDPNIDYCIEALSGPPAAVINMTTAAFLQGMIAKDPRELWLAIPPATANTEGGGLLEVYTMREADLDVDGHFTWPAPGCNPVARMDLAGRGFLVTSPARTVADLFSYRDTPSVGHATADEALRSALDLGTLPEEIEAFAAQARASAHILPQVRAAMSSGLRR